MMTRRSDRPTRSLLPPDILPTGGRADPAALRDQAALWRQLAGGFDPRSVRTAIEKAAGLELQAARLERTRRGR